MSSSTCESLVIHASAHTVMNILTDFTQYPLWSKDIKKVVIVDDHQPPSHVQFTVEAVWIKETYELNYLWKDNPSKQTSMQWELVSSTLQKSQNGEINIVKIPEGVRVDYSIFIELKIPLIAPLRRKIQSYIAHTALRSLKAYAESR